MTPKGRFRQMLGRNDSRATGRQDEMLVVVKRDLEIKR